ncbi:MAG: phage portal protein [Planctomycetaceae bacterium]|nr:phage portal protein [Planctomycetaceae bacterium]
MAFDFSKLEAENINPAFINWLVDEQWVDMQSHFGKLWDYYQNPMYSPIGLSAADSKLNESAKTYIQAQEMGLPVRITGIKRTQASGITGGKAVADVERKEVVIENDIGWRVNAMVDFLFGKGVDIVSRAEDKNRRTEIDKIIKQVFNSNGGVRFFQDMAVLGAVYGFVDCIVRPGQKIAEFLRTPGIKPEANEVMELVSDCSLELIEAQRALPILDERDYRKINFYVQHFIEQKNDISSEGNFLRRLLSPQNSNASRRTTAVTEVLSADWWQRYEDKQLVSEGANLLGILPVVHIQNIAQPLYYEGISDVEALIPLQDELNTRLSDRASRITFQAFKMYLAKGIEGVENRAVSPGRMWCTDNPDASIQQFGGDSSSPSEDVHIQEIREALDKTSGVTPVAAGVLKDKIGNLTSAIALKMTLMGMLAKTERKHYAYGQGLKEIAAMVMHLLDVTKIYPNAKDERVFDVIFPSPLPENTSEKLDEAKMKLEIGVSKEQVLRELGYEMKI